MTNPKIVFLVAGRTGGPIFPLLAIEKQLHNIKPVIIGVREGIEVEIAQRNNLDLHFLHQVKLDILSYRKSSVSERVLQLVGLIKQILLFIANLAKSLLLVLKFRPNMIISTGSFLSVPLIWICALTNFIKLTDTKIVIHQQDPLPGLSNKLTARFADLLTCVFEYTKHNFTAFQSAQIIPNPIDFSKFDNLDSRSFTAHNPDLSAFINQSSLPIMLIFGGGTGARVINEWVWSNISWLCARFRVIHLTGALQNTADKVDSINSNDNYFTRDSLFEQMPFVLRKSDVVLCRSGLSSITELLYLAKPAYLVPISHSHQEINAEMVKDYFYILDQEKRTEWKNIISTTYPQFFHKIQYPSASQTKEGLNQYYLKINLLLDNTRSLT